MMSETNRGANAEPYACDMCDRYEKDLIEARAEVERLRAVMQFPKGSGYSYQASTEQGDPYYYIIEKDHTSIAKTKSVKSARQIVDGLNECLRLRAQAEERK